MGAVGSRANSLNSHSGQIAYYTDPVGLDSCLAPPVLQVTLNGCRAIHHLESLRGGPQPLNPCPSLSLRGAFSNPTETAQIPEPGF